jgi:hypothetical protein
MQLRQIMGLFLVKTWAFVGDELRVFSCVGLTSETQADTTLLQAPTQETVDRDIGLMLPDGTHTHTWFHMPRVYRGLVVMSIESW